MIHVSTVGIPDTNVEQGVVEPTSLAYSGVSNTCAMTPGGQSPSSQQLDSDTVHLPITPALIDFFEDLD